MAEKRKRREKRERESAGGFRTQKISCCGHGATRRFEREREEDAGGE